MVAIEERPGDDSEYQYPPKDLLAASNGLRTLLALNETGFAKVKYRPDKEGECDRNRNQVGHTPFHRTTRRLSGAGLEHRLEFTHFCLKLGGTTITHTIFRMED